MTKKTETESLPSCIFHSTYELFNATLKCTLSYYIMQIKGFLLQHSPIRTYKVLSSLKVTKVTAKVVIIFLCRNMSPWFVYSLSLSPSSCHRHLVCLSYRWLQSKEQQRHVYAATLNITWTWKVIRQSSYGF